MISFSRILQGFTRHLSFGHLGHLTLCHPMQSFGYRYACQLLQRAVRNHDLDPNCIHSVCDFGSGVGGPALATQAFFNLPAHQMTLLEEDPRQVRGLHKLLPGAEILEGDGLQWLAATQKQFDLITAYMLGPDFHHSGLAEGFIHAATACLSSHHGKLLIATDIATMHVVKNVLKTLPNIACHWLIPDEDQGIPMTVFVSKTNPNNNATAAPITDMLLPAPVLANIQIPDHGGQWTTETYSLSNRFERDYLRATIATFEALTPNHPGLPHLKHLLKTFASAPGN
ncbi:MAG TPA: class I SAM-dependent methyltransferase [Coleofasciculaceae cyanobacterium]